MGKKLAFIGLFITAAYLALLAFVFWGRVVQILLMEPNEIGDFLAGVFGPLAILWLILGFFQQGIELRQNTDALKVQADELKRSVEQQQAAALAMKEQVAATRDTLEFERSKHASISMPRFAASLKSHMSAHGATTIFVVLRNVGGVAARIKLAQPIGVGQIEFTHAKSVVAWDSGEERGLKFEMSDDAYRGVSDVDFTLRFEDSEGVKLVQKFSLSRDSQTGMPSIDSFPPHRA